MAKKQRPSFDRHHILFEKALWTTRKETMKLRQETMLIPPLDRDVHEALHRDCPIVPAMGYHAIVRTVGTFRAVPGDYLGTMDNLFQSIEQACNHPAVKSIEYDLGGLVIGAIEMQKPFIRDGLVRGRNG